MSLPIDQSTISLKIRKAVVNQTFVFKINNIASELNSICTSSDEDDLFSLNINTLDKSLISMGKYIINNLITNQSNLGNQIETTSDELRIYGMGAQILSEIGVKKMILLTNTEWKFIGLDAFDIEIIETKFLNNIND